MARPRVFVSSTYYDLKHLRSALEAFIESMGFEPVLSEKGAIAYVSDAPLDESCYREAEQADIMVLIVGGRYGSERSGEKKRDKDFFDRYDSITREEFRAATESNVPLYVLIDRGVHAEYETFKKNRKLRGIKYAHVDSPNVFELIEEILALPKNNPVFQFERFHEIESWLREQWAGLFRELLRRQTGQEQIATLAAQVALMTETNKTLKTYLESLMTMSSPTKAAELIQSEDQRLNAAANETSIRDIPFVEWLFQQGITFSALAEIVRSETSVRQTIEKLTDEACKDQAYNIEFNPLDFHIFTHATHMKYSFRKSDISRMRVRLRVPNRG